jgi:D-ribose pyranose/furanose isomerase RbsD
MNEVGAFIWEVIDSNCSFDELVNRVYEEYDVEKNVIATDIRNFLEKLATFVTTA